MFIGLIDWDDRALWPEVVSRVAMETVTWDCIYAGPNKIAFVNRKSMIFKVYKSFEEFSGLALFKEADDVKPSTPVIVLENLSFGKIEAGSLIQIAAGKIRLDSEITRDHRWDSRGKTRPRTR